MKKIRNDNRGVAVSHLLVHIMRSHSLVKMSFEHYMPHIESNWNLSKLSSAKHRNHEVNADGFGIGWYDREVDDEPCIFSRYASSPAFLPPHRALDRFYFLFMYPCIQFIFESISD
jgi:hypothetical protein